MRAERNSIAGWIERVTASLDREDLYFGHGTDNPRDEAAWLVLHVVGATLDGTFADWGRAVDEVQQREIERLVEARCQARQPLAYLIGAAWFGGMEFELTPDVLVPRSPIAELIEDGFRPWLDPRRVSRALDVCTGCGCIAISLARRLPHLGVDATDISEEALRVAARNVQRHGLQQRIRLLQSDLFQSVPACRYDLIVANPPYVPIDEATRLPAEYLSEPDLALVSGTDGLDATLRILRDAPDYLAEDGILVCEVGESEARLAQLLPRVPFVWLEFARGGSGVFLLDWEGLQAGRELVEEQIRQREDVA